MLISVCIASYNHERYIRQCIRSVADQDYGPIELVIVDDASTDGSWQEIREVVHQSGLRARFSNVIVSRNTENLGAGETWNRAIDRSSGELIFLLNSDDMFMPNRVSTFVEEYPTRSLFFGFSDVRTIDHRGDVFCRPGISSIITTASFRAADRFPFLSWAFLEHQCAISTGNFVFDRALWNINRPFKQLQYCHDWDFALRAVCSVEPILSRKTSYLYRLHESNSFHTLGGVATDETRVCFSEYIRCMSAEVPINKTCLSPVNFGRAFINYAQSLESWHWIKTMMFPYQPGQRTTKRSVQLSTYS